MSEEAFRLDPRLAADTVAVAEWPLCSLRLVDDARWPWLILVPRIAAARELIDLAAADRARVVTEVDTASRVLRDVFSPEKLNVAAIGNVVSQLHIHVVARRRDDPAWPAPVWGFGAREPCAPAARDRRLAQILAALEANPAAA